MKKKTVLAMLVMCMVFSASACSDKSAETSAPEKTESSAEKTDKASLLFCRVVVMAGISSIIFYIMFRD